MSLSIAVDGVCLSFLWSHFESVTYTHCSIPYRFASSPLFPAISALVSSRQQEIPWWFHYDNLTYYNNLQSLPAAVLVSAAQTCISCKSACHTKKDVLQLYWLILLHGAQSSCR
jgi:hypothetical protein